MQRLPATETRDIVAIANANIMALWSTLGVYTKAKINQEPVDILGPNGLAILHKDCKEDKSKREAFISFLETASTQDLLKARANQLKDSRLEKQPISLEELLGKAGASLYREAILEEYKDAAFRDKVLLESTSFHPRQKFEKRKIMPIMGPASAGKSHATDAAIAAITTPSHDPNEGNLFVNSDGEIERKCLQIRSLVDGIAKTLGFGFVSDIDNLGIINKAFGHKIKEHIKKAVLATADVNLTIPDTNTNPKKNFADSLKEYEKLENTEIIFVEVRAKAGKETVMKDTVNQLGNARALVQGKIYEPKHYDKGVEKSAQAREIYFNKSRDQKYIAITNDLIFIAKTEDRQRRTMDNPKIDALIISEHDFATWQIEYDHAKMELDSISKNLSADNAAVIAAKIKWDNISDIETWLKTGIEEGTLGKPLLKIMNREQIMDLRQGKLSYTPDLISPGSSSNEEDKSKSALERDHRSSTSSLVMERLQQENEENGIKDDIEICELGIDEEIVKAKYPTSTPPPLLGLLLHWHQESNAIAKPDEVLPLVNPAPVNKQR